MIKSNTSLEQSKKLAEFLPPESADMWWLYVPAQGKHIAMMYEEPDPHYIARMENYYGIKDAAIRCWSLAALQDVIKIESNLHGFYSDCEKVYRMETLYAGNSKTYDNPIDACVDLIKKLHEQNIL